MFFYNELVNFIKQEYKHLITTSPNPSFIDLVDFSKKYAAHIKNIQKFDEEVEFNQKLGYTKPLVEQLSEDLEKINPELIKLFSLEPIVLLSL